MFVRYQIEKIEKEASLMSKCIIAVAIIVLVGLATYVAVVRFGIYEFLSKLKIAIIPSAIFGTLACIFIWLNRNYWKSIETEATSTHFATWFFLVLNFIIWPIQLVRIIVYFLGFLWPINWINLVKTRKMPISCSLMLGLHGGVGAYCMVVTANFLLSVAGIPLPVAPAKFLTSFPLPKDAFATIIPYQVLASMVSPAIILVLYACFVEEVMFRLPLALFKKFGMYPVAFLVSFLFIYLHALSRLSLDSLSLLQVLTCIACANAVFVALYTRTLCIWCSIVAHLVYNLMVLASVPPFIAFILLLFCSMLYIAMAKMCKVGTWSRQSS